MKKVSLETMMHFVDQFNDLKPDSRKAIDRITNGDTNMNGLDADDLDGAIRFLREQGFASAGATISSHLFGIGYY